MMNKKAVTSVMLILATMNINAQKEEKTMKVFSDIKFSGYIMTQYQYSSQETLKATRSTYAWRACRSRDAY